MQYSEPSIYSNLKDFAGPAATVFAALVAASVTAVFVRRQWRTAQHQADIAFDQLRYNVFEKRYAIYTAAREAITITLHKQAQDTWPVELDTLFLRFEEARFFFPNEIHSFLDQLRNEIKTFLNMNFSHRKYAAEHTGPQNEAIRGKLLADEDALLKMEEGLYVTSLSLAKTFADALAFPQLTAHSPARAKSAGTNL